MNLLSLILISSNHTERSREPQTAQREESTAGKNMLLLQAAATWTASLTAAAPCPTRPHAACIHTRAARRGEQLQPAKAAGYGWPEPLPRLHPAPPPPTGEYQHQAAEVDDSQIWPPPWRLGSGRGRARPPPWQHGTRRDPSSSTRRMLVVTTTDECEEDRNLLQRPTQ